MITTVQNLPDGGFLVDGVKSVPNDSANTDYQEVQKWIAEGNTPDPYVAPVKTWYEKRTAMLANGGYGTPVEQLEIIGEQGVAAFQKHIARIKTAHPKT